MVASTQGTSVSVQRCSTFGCYALGIVIPAINCSDDSKSSPMHDGDVKQSYKRKVKKKSLNYIIHI